MRQVRWVHWVRVRRVRQVPECHGWVRRVHRRVRQVPRVRCGRCHGGCGRCSNTLILASWSFPKVVRQAGNGHRRSFDQIEDFGGLLVGHEPTLCGLDDSVFYLTKRAFRDGEEAREFGVGAARETFGDITCHGSRGASQLIDQVAIACNRGRLDEVRDARAKLVRELIADQILKPAGTGHAQRRCIARAVWILEETLRDANRVSRFLLSKRGVKPQILPSTCRTAPGAPGAPDAPVAPRTQCTQRT